MWPLFTTTAALGPCHIAPRCHRGAPTARSRRCNSGPSMRPVAFSPPCGCGVTLRAASPRRAESGPAFLAQRAEPARQILLRGERHRDGAGTDEIGDGHVITVLGLRPEGDDINRYSNPSTGLDRLSKVVAVAVQPVDESAEIGIRVGLRRGARPCRCDRGADLPVCEGAADLAFMIAASNVLLPASVGLFGDGGGGAVVEAQPRLSSMLHFPPVLIR